MCWASAFSGIGRVNVQPLAAAAQQVYPVGSTVCHLLLLPFCSLEWIRQYHNYTITASTYEKAN
jgi:hypothetical protein